MKLLLGLVIPVLVASSALALMVELPFARPIWKEETTADDRATQGALTAPVALATAVALAGMAAALELSSEEVDRPRVEAEPRSTSQ
jgi:hypothetical protein